MTPKAVSAWCAKIYGPENLSVFFRTFPYFSESFRFFPFLSVSFPIFPYFSLSFPNGAGFSQEQPAVEIFAPPLAERLDDG